MDRDTNLWVSKTRNGETYTWRVGDSRAERQARRELYPKASDAVYDTLYTIAAVVVGILYFVSTDGPVFGRLFMSAVAGVFWPVGVLMIDYSNVLHAVGTFIIWSALLALAFMILYVVIHFVGTLFTTGNRQYENFEEYAAKDKQFRKQLLDDAFVDQEAVFFKDGTSYSVADGIRTWYKNGVPHRKNGPALLWDDGTTEWFIDGVEVTEAQAYAAK